MSRMKMAAAAALVLSIVAASEAGAQWNVARFGMEKNRAYTSFGLDPAFVGTVGYARVVRVMEHDWQLAGDAGLVTASMDARDFRARLGTQTSLLRWRSVHLTGSAMAVVRGTDNAVYRGFNWGADVTGTLGVYRPRWFAAGELGKDKAIVTHITHSDWYRENFYPDAKDGWYLDAGGTVRSGITSGITIGRTELAMRAGWQRTERWNATTSPVYASLGVGVGF
jgi:hypothetical protein